ncbi:uncharacterized protein LOC117788875 [Drosophila innubila]|uniref:uncharacterized protein LOC117788875 n=1 Tax=Drosophila innubila TaxID=198719 RepID=UPI00148C3CC0|nr:uncharacterized protein LOC117788875 [Drosophila innubila]
MLLKSLLLLCCLVLIKGAEVPEEEENPAPILQFLNDDQIATFLSEIPDAIKLSPEVTVQSSKARREYEPHTLRWTIGSRQTGDAVVYSNAQPIQWFDNFSNLKLIVTYPKTGSGKIVTYVSIELQQSNRLFHAYVFDGGIGERNIELYVQAYHTRLFSWDIKIYGKD